MFALILARNQKGIIGMNGEIPWYISNDLKRFKKITTKYQNMIMGRITFETFKHPLKDRMHYVLSKKSTVLHYGNYNAPNVLLIETLDDLSKHKNYIFIGGAEIASQFMDKISIVYMTTVFKDLPMCDSYDYTVFDYDLSRTMRCTSTERFATHNFETWKRK